MNILYLQTKRKSWIWDFLILTIELMVSCLPKRLRFILEPTNQSSVINQKDNIVEKQSGGLNYEPDNSTTFGGGATEEVRSISQIFG